MTDRSAQLDVRRFITFAIALFMAFAVTVAITSDVAQAGKKSKKAKVTVKVQTKNQANLVKAKKLNLIVKATAPTTMKVKAISGGKSNRFGVRIIRFNKAKTKRFPLSMTKPGRKSLVTCGAKTVKVVARYSKFKKGKKVRKAQRKKTLAKSASLCAPKPPPVVTPVKSTCDPLDNKVCMQPWPSNFYTKVDPSSTTTGLKLDVPAAAMPKNADGKSITLPDIDRADGFSPGNLIVTKIPQVQTPAAFNNSGIVSLDDVASYEDPNAPVMVIDAATGARQPIYAELDANPTTKSTVKLTAGQPPVEITGGHPNDDPTNTGDVNVIIRAAKNFKPGHRYVVVLRSLKDASNAAVPAAAPFEACKGDLAKITDPGLLYRCNQLADKVFPVLSQNGVAKDASLYMAWDFTVASQKSLTGRMTTIRDDAFKRLGDTNLADRKIDGASPDVDITAFCDISNTATPACGGGPNMSPVPPAGVKRYVDGFIRNVPCYLDVDGCATGAEFSFDGNDKLTWNSSFKTDVPFRCLIPDSTVAGGTVHPAKTGIYGHGLLGTLNQVRGQNALANQQNSIWCATNFDGFADNDFPTVAASLKDLSNFNKLTDRMQQGFVNFMMLGRAALHQDGMTDEPAFQIDPDGAGSEPASSVIDTSGGTTQRGYYHGVSQGGIMGGALTAVDPDVDRGVLNVPAINYSTLLPRSVDFDEYAHGVLDLGGGAKYYPGVGLYDNYTNKAEYPVIFSVMQLLWDRGEGNGYVQAMNPANPNLPNTNPHRVILQLANGDHQVANAAAEVEARTLGALTMTPSLNVGRHWGINPLFGLNGTAAPIPSSNNIMVYYDGGPETFTGDKQGSKVAPVENVPPRPQWGYGGDPHGYPRASQDGKDQAIDFLNQDPVTACIDPAGYCYSNSWTGP